MNSSDEDRVPGPPKGQRDHSRTALTRHAVDRFVERFWEGDPEARVEAEAALRAALARTRRLGRNVGNAAVAVLAAYGDRMLVAILQANACTTVLTWPQFQPRLAEFGRARLPKKRNRMMRRLKEGPARG